MLDHDKLEIRNREAAIPEVVAGVVVAGGRSFMSGLQSIIS